MAGDGMTETRPRRQQAGTTASKSTCLGRRHSGQRHDMRKHSEQPSLHSPVVAASQRAACGRPQFISPPAGHGPRLALVSGCLAWVVPSYPRRPRPEL